MKVNEFCVRTLCILAAVLTIISIPLNAADKTKQEQKARHVNIKGADVIRVQGSTRHWKDTNKISLDRLPGPRRMRPIRNFKYRRPLDPSVKETADPVVQRNFRGRNAADRPGPSALTTPIQSFDGMNLTANGAGWPPDTNGDVGQTYYIQTVNTSIGIYRKSDGGLVSATTFDSFFAGASVSGTPCDNDNNGDPIVLYDQYAQRWFILDFAWDSSETDGSYYSIAVSKTSDPTGAWWQYAFRADNTLMNDYPKVGIWHDGIYITANMFSFAGGFQGVKTWALKKPDIYSGTLISQSVYDTSYYAWSLLPANAKGSTAPPAGSPNYLYSFDSDQYGGPSTDALILFKYDVDWNNSANTTYTGPTITTAAAHNLRTTDVPQKDTAGTLDVLGYRLMYSAFYRNFGTHETIYLNHTVDVGGIAAVRWYEVRLSGGTPSIYQQGTYNPDSHHRWMASIGADKYGNIALGYSTSSSTLYPGIRYAGRLSTDTAGTMGQGEEILINGGGYQSGFQRWGDYSMMSIDPVDDETFWFTTEYYSASGTNWKTRIGSFKLAESTGINKHDFDKNGTHDILWRNSSTGKNLIWYMSNATRSSLAYTTTVTDQNWQVAGTGDFDNDGNTDILWRNPTTGQNLIWYMSNASRSSMAYTTSVTGNTWQIKGLGDFDKDGNIDILWRNMSSGKNLIWYMANATRSSTAYTTTVTDLNYDIAGVADFDKDGNVDILWRNPTTGQNLIWYMDNAFRSSMAYTTSVTGATWQIKSLLDLDGDGNVDILWRNTSTGKNLIWYMNNASRTGLAYTTSVTDQNWDIVNR